jgi:hypothetical protein
MLSYRYRYIRIHNTDSYYNPCAGMKNVMMITSTTPIIGVTMDDGRQKPALYKQYDFGYDNMVAVT